MPINLSWSEFKKLVDTALKFEVQALVIGNLNKDRNDSNIKDVIPETIKGSIVVNQLKISRQFNI